MDQHRADIKRIDEYINSLDKVEARKRKSTYVFIIPIAVLVIAGLLTIFSFSTKKSEPLVEGKKEGKKERNVPAIPRFADLNFSEVRQHFQSQKGALQVEVAEMGKTVSLSSEKEYWQLLEELSLHFLDEEALNSDAESSQMLVMDENTSENMEVLVADIRKVENTKVRKRPLKKKVSKETFSTSNAQSQEEKASPKEITPQVVNSQTEVFEAPASPQMAIDPKVSEKQKLIEKASNSDLKSPKIEELSEKVSKGPLVIASQKPTFPGGEGDLTSYLNSRIKYPEPAKDYHVEGTVYVQFVVQPDGRLTHHKVLKGLGYGCDEEALRITRTMPNWYPGEQNGEKVPVLFTLPVNFELLN